MAKKKSNVVYQDNMGMIHIWRNCDLNKFESRGMHHAGSLCEGREADVLLQSNPEYWAKRNLSKEQRDNIEGGFAIRKRKFKDLEDSWQNPYGD